MFTVETGVIIACTLVLFWGLRSIAVAVRRVADVLYQTADKRSVWGELRPDATDGTAAPPHVAGSETRRGWPQP